MTLAIMVLMVVVAPKVINRFGFKTPIVAGMPLLPAGMAVMSLVRADTSYPRPTWPPPRSTTHVTHPILLGGIAWRHTKGASPCKPS